MLLFYRLSFDCIIDLMFIKDAYVDGLGVMHVDEHHDDCRRASYSKRRKDTDGVARLEFIRSFDTCHLDDYKEEDYLIEDGTIHVVYASGSGPLYRLAFVDFSTMAGIILLSEK